MKNKKAAQQLGRKGGKSKSSAKVDAAKKNGAKGGRPKEVWKLYELEREMPIKVYVEASDGSKFITVDHLDGMYSYCITEKGAIVHLAGGAPLKKHKDGWKLN